MRLRSRTRCRCRLARRFRRRRRSGHFFLRLMLSSIFGIMLGASFGNDLLLHRRLILHKFNVRHLRSGRRWNQKEESENKAGNDAGKMENVRSAGGFRQFDDVFRIYLFALDYSCSVICITGCICEIGKKESHDHH